MDDPSVVDLMRPPPIGAPAITVVVNAFRGGGAEYVGRTWARTLRDAGWPVRLVVLTSLTAEDRRMAGDLLPVVEELAGSRWRRYLRLRGLLSASRSMALVSLQMRPNLLTTVLSRTVPRSRRTVAAISERNIVSIYAEDASSAHRRRVRLAKLLYRLADRLIAISHPVAAEMVAGFGVRPERCVVVPNPAAGKAAGRPRLPQPDSCLSLVVVGRLAPQKRPALAVEVAARLQERGHPTRLIVFGDGPLREGLRTAAANHGVEVELRGWVEDWPVQVPDGAVLLLTSVKEGFGNVLVEAARRGVPSVATSQALGVADALVPGVTGELALTSSADDLSDAVLRARGVTFAGAEEWLRRFTPEASTAALLRALFSPLDQENRC